MKHPVEPNKPWLRLLRQRLGNAAMLSRRGRRSHLLRRLLNGPGRMS